MQKEEKNNQPKISIVIPTLNAISVLKPCLESISAQDYPKEKIEILVCDGGSNDGTQELAKQYGAIVLENPLRTGEAGKSVGVKAANGEFIALIDSDNILSYNNWLYDMLVPLQQEPSAIGSEPWEYTWRRHDGFITRYCALIGMNDPLVHFLGNYDRINHITGKWTQVPHEEKDKGNYLLVTLDKRGIPTIGANGTVFRASYLKKEVSGDYLFDIDIIAKTIKEKGSVNFIKVKNGIIHTFCESDISKFVKKQRRRVDDFLYHNFILKDRSFEWFEMDIKGKNPVGLLKFILSCVTVFPLIYQTIKGYLNKSDPAWLFHPLACYITFWEYGWGRIRGTFKKAEVSREGWKQ